MIFEEQRPREEREVVVEVDAAPALADAFAVVAGEEDGPGVSSARNEESWSSGWSSDSSHEEDGAFAVDEFRDQGWSADGSCSPPSTSTIDGLPIASVGEAGEYSNFSFRQSSNIHVGPRTVIEGLVTIVYSGPVAGERSVAGLKIDGAKAAEALKNAAARDDSGQKPSTESTRPLFPGMTLPAQGKAAHHWIWTRRCAITACAAAALLLALSILLADVLNGASAGTSTASKPTYAPIFPNDTSLNNDPTIPGVRIVPCIEWIAQPLVREPTPLKVKPVHYVVISHTATTFCYTQAQCVLTVRVAQTFHIESI